MTIPTVSITNPTPLTGAGVRDELYDCCRRAEGASSARQFTDAFDRAVSVLEMAAGRQRV